MIILNSEVQCVALYKKPSCHLQVLCKTLENKFLPFMQNNAKTVIMGDFNLDLTSKCHEKFLKFMKEKFSCNQMMKKVTTKNNTQLYLVFTDFQNVQTEVLEAYWSDHNMIYCATDL